VAQARNWTLRASALQGRCELDRNCAEGDAPALHDADHCDG
jgi:hypothetical protein